MIITNPFLSILSSFLEQESFTTDIVTNAPNQLVVLYNGQPLFFLDSEGYVLRSESNLPKRYQDALYSKVCAQFATAYCIFMNPTAEQNLNDLTQGGAENLLMDALEDEDFNAKYLNLMPKTHLYLWEYPEPKEQPDQETRPPKEE